LTVAGDRPSRSAIWTLESRVVKQSLQSRSHVPNRKAARRRRRSSLAGDDAGIPPGQAAQEQRPTLSADPPTVKEIIAVMSATGNGADGARLRALIIVLWRAGLRISEALDLAETDLDRSRGAVVVRAGKGGRRREVSMDRWAWGQLTWYLEIRATLPVGALFCVVHGPTAFAIHGLRVYAGNEA
jgi:integrase